MNINWNELAVRAVEALESIAAELADLNCTVGNLADTIQADRDTLAAQQAERDRAMQMAAERRRERYDEGQDR